LTSDKKLLLEGGDEAEGRQAAVVQSRESARRHL